MRLILRLVSCWLVCAAVVAGAPSDDVSAVRAAEAQRLVATIAADTTALAPLLSEDLRYAYSDGREQTKREFLAAVASNRVKYLSITPDQVEIQPIAPGAMAVHGRAKFAAIADGRRTEFTLRFLAVWRSESGLWRLFAYQSSQLSPVK